MRIVNTTFDRLPTKKEGAVLLGCGGDVEDWLVGVTDLWVTQGIGTGKIKDMISGAYKLTTTGGRTDLLLLFAENTTLDMGKLAMWRLRFGDASWLSDYVDNYASQHGFESSEG
jgi:hypothetical protein